MRRNFSKYLYRIINHSLYCFIVLPIHPLSIYLNRHENKQWSDSQFWISKFACIVCCCCCCCWIVSFSYNDVYIIYIRLRTEFTQDMQQYHKSHKTQTRHEYGSGTDLQSRTIIGIELQYIVSGTRDTSTRGTSRRSSTRQSLCGTSLCGL